MTELFTSEHFQLKAHQESYLREEIFVSAFDAQRAGLRTDKEHFCLFAIEDWIPGFPDKEFAVRLVIKPSLEPGVILINKQFLDSEGFTSDDERPWTIKTASNIVPIRDAVLELVLEQGNIEREIRNLQRRDLFLNRCRLIKSGQAITDLKLPMERGYFNFRSIQPAPDTIGSKSIFVFDNNTSLNLFVPHRKSGVDMVIVVDASGSMNLCDYVGADGRPRSRLQGVREALEILFQRRLASGSRVSSIAVVLFGANTKMLYPSQEAMVEIKGEEQVIDMQRTLRELSPAGLRQVGVDRSGTDISLALQYAAELLDYYAQEANEKILVLLSDGAHWTEDATGDVVGEIINTTRDPAVLADSLHYNSKVRIHTVSISDEQAMRKYAAEYFNQQAVTPNTKLLNKIADFTQGLFIASPDARSLARLFEELGEGALYPV